MPLIVIIKTLLDDLFITLTSLTRYLLQRRASGSWIRLHAIYL
jgi:hypothetical protein